MIGFIGAGNMATAMICGMLGGGVSASEIAAYDISSARMDVMREMGVQAASSPTELAKACDTLIIAVKPKFVRAVLDDLRSKTDMTYNVLSIAVGWTQAMLTELLPDAKGIAHAMPNTPAQVREGVIVINENHTLEVQQFAALVEKLSACGRTIVLPEPLMDAVTGISGSGPAYVYMFIEALADAGVRQGLPRDIAYTLSAQTLLGAAKMVLETGQHPGALKDAVTSPGGTTIEAVYALEKAGLRGAVMDAVDACARKASQMAK